jgi:hypothetical protein
MNDKLKYAVLAATGWFLVGVSANQKLEKDHILAWHVTQFCDGTFGVNPVTLYGCRANTDDLRLLLAPDGTFHDTSSGREYASEAAAIAAMFGNMTENELRSTLADEKRQRAMMM